MTSTSRLMNILRSPLISEKSNRLAGEMRTVVFRVLPDANKHEIREAVEKVFNVRVESVNTLNMQGKRTRRTIHGRGRRPNWKKAYVTLAPGENLGLTPGEEKI